MIHTISLIQYLSPEHLEYLMSLLCFTQQERHRLLRSLCFQTVHRDLNSHDPENGIKDFFILRRDDDPLNATQYFAVIEIEPLVMLRATRTIELFHATPLHVALFQQRFHDILVDFFHDSPLSYLETWNCRRIDYTFNFHFDSNSTKRLFLDMTKKTSRYIRTQPKRIYSLKINNQSTAEGNQSVKILFYDKKKQIDDTFSNSSVAQKKALMLAADHIVRFEVQCKKGRVLTLQRKYHFPNRRILHFLNEQISYDLLLDEYLKSVGRGDFFSFYWAKKTINQSSFSKPKKQRLIHLLQLIAQARHVNIAQQQFIAGTLIKRTNIFVKGSNTTFQHYLRDLTSLGINPMLIPKERKTTHLLNPITQLELQAPIPQPEAQTEDSTSQGGYYDGSYDGFFD